MLATILLVLKIIGFVLLGIIGLFLVLLLAVLFVPVRYRIKGSYYGELKGKAAVSWLIHIISISVTYDGEADMAVRIFGIRVGKRTGKEERSKEPEKDPVTKEPEMKDPIPEDPIPEDPIPENPIPEDPIDLHEPPRETASAKKRKTKKATNPFSFRKVCDKLKAWIEKKDEILSAVQDERNKKTWRLLVRQFKRLIRHLLPTRAVGKIRFGFDDPYTTGQVLQYLSPFYGKWSKRFLIIPVFDTAVLEGEVDLKGRIRLGTILGIGIRVLLDKNVRRLIKKARN